MSLRDSITINGSIGNRGKEMYIQKHYPNEYNLIIHFCEINNLVQISWLQKLYHYMYDIKGLPKCICGNNRRFRPKSENYKKYLMNNGYIFFYTEYCSNKCSTLNTATKRMATLKSNLLNNYNVTNVFQLNEVKEKSRETNLKKYGFEYASQSKSIKEKIKITNLDKYGVEHTLQLQDIKEKSKETNLKKYGFEYSSQNSDIKKKTKETNIEKYGVNSPSECEFFRKNEFKIAQDINYLYYKGDRISIFKCDCGCDGEHEFEIHKDIYYSRSKSNNPLCTICYPVNENVSIQEKTLLSYIKDELKLNIIENYRDQYEIDIYIPEFKIGIEFNGLFWHSFGKKKKSYHIDKSIYFGERDIRIIHIWEDDWIDKREIIKSQIRSILGMTKDRIFARNCVVKEIEDYKSFLDNNHIQGYVNSVLRFGLYYNSSLVSIMTFDHFEGRKKMNLDEWNLSRYCTIINTIVVGGASKMFSYFKTNYKPSRVISYADKDWSVGNLYTKIGFEKVYETKPDYKYIINNKRIHKSRFRTDKLLTEKNKTQEFLKIYDCGKIKFEVKFNL